MIDLHTHILPGCDDGAVDLEMALAMGRSAFHDGITTLAATPHFYEIPRWSTVQQKVGELQEEFVKAQIAVEVVAGAELLMDISLLDMEREEIPTYGDRGKYCLIELPALQVPVYAEQVLFVLQTKGITPIIAHPERYGAVARDPNVVLRWLQQGCLIQMNSGSILGRFGQPIQETAQILLAQGMVQVVASDGHGSGHRRINLVEAFDVLVGIVGSTKAKDLVETNPRSILDGDFQLKEEPLEYRKKKRFFFSRFA